MYGIILYGPPAVGKDTVTRALTALDPRFVLFPRLKVGAGRTAGYRMSTTQEVEALRARAEVVWENHRYGSLYVIDRPYLMEELAQGVPVLHLGQDEAITAIKSAIPAARWLTVELWCSWDVAATRIDERQTGDTDARLTARRETQRLGQADLRIDTGETSPEVAARQIRQSCVDSIGSSRGPKQRGLVHDS